MPYADPQVQTAYQAGYLQGLRRAWLEAHGPCAKCGSLEDLEVDHVDEAGKVSHRVWSWSRERREAELAKCQVLCSRCHREKSASAQRKPLVHGTLNAYKKKRCRCAQCTAAASAYARTLRQRSQEVR